jgi:4-diphosphocytidyl-2-C-methyl-D-erythritol kinase
MPPLAIRLTKRIPAQRGLGGGSSDAAGLLRAAGRLLGLPVPERALSEVARAIGADVPFFLVGGTAKGRGYGDLVTPLDDAPTMWLVVASPAGGCETAAAYRKLDAKPRVWRDFPDGCELHNDFESVAPEDSLRLKRRLIDAGALGALLCGSGSAVFGVFDSKEEADQAAEELNAEGIPFAASTRSLSRSESLVIEEPAIT